MAIECTPGRSYNLNVREEYHDFRRDFESVIDADIWAEYDNAENWAILLEAFGNEITLPTALDIYNRFRNTNRILSSEDREAATQAELEPESEEQVVEPSEHEMFYTTRSGLEIRERMARDLEFVKYAKARMASEFQYGAGAPQQFYWPVLRSQADTPEAAAEFVEQDTDGKVIYDRTWPIIETKDEFRVPVIRRDGGPPLEVTDIHLALRKFAQQYVQTPASQLRPIMGYVTTQDGSRYDVVKFNQLVAEAAAAKLI